MDRLVEGGLVAGVTPVASASAGAHAVPAAAVATPSPASTTAPAGEQDWRFDMRQDGKAMTADEFDAWMRARRARVATGKAGKPDPYGSAAPVAVAKAARSDEQTSELQTLMRITYAVFCWKKKHK